MTPKQILDSFSETLMRDERILSAQECALLAAILQHARASTAQNPTSGEAVRAVIASAVGETVAQRAFAVLGGSIVDRILNSSQAPDDPEPVKPDEIYTRGQGVPGSPGPQPPGSAPGQPQTPAYPLRPREQPQTPAAQPQTPAAQPQTPASQPQTPAAQPQTPATPLTPAKSGHSTVVSQTGMAVAERPLLLPAQCVVLDEFLAPQELEELTRFTLDHEADFSASEVISASAESGVVNHEHRRSRVLLDLGRHESVMLERIKSALPEILRNLGMEPFSIAGVEAQVTASNDGDFFRFHSDNGSDPVACRYLTFVYFFHREPRQFEGGELRIHDARLEGGIYVSEGRYQAIVPRQNQIVFFPCEMQHEITPVTCPSRRFADSRFTLNGWLRR
jgi:Rps23 Pro-64 3,4-dihydroxylase Tpa1-like proline 4-hydroxylase